MYIYMYNIVIISDIIYIHVINIYSYIYIYVYMCHIYESMNVDGTYIYISQPSTTCNMCNAHGPACACMLCSC